MRVDGDTHLALSYSCVEDHDDAGELLRYFKESAGELGVVSDGVEAYVINDFGRKHDVHIDFYSVGTVLEALERARKEDHPEGTRYVFAGGGRRDEVVADRAGWLYVDFDELLAGVED